MPGNIFFLISLESYWFDSNKYSFLRFLHVSRTLWILGLGPSPLGWWNSPFGIEVTWEDIEVAKYIVASVLFLITVFLSGLEIRLKGSYWPSYSGLTDNTCFSSIKWHKNTSRCGSRSIISLLHNVSAHREFDAMDRF